MGYSKHAGYLEASDQLDDPCDPQQSKQLLNAQQVTNLQSQHSLCHIQKATGQAVARCPKSSDTGS